MLCSSWFTHQSLSVCPTGSYEQPSHIIEAASLGWPSDGGAPVGGTEVGEEQLREHLAEAMHEVPTKTVRGHTRATGKSLHAIGGEKY